MNSETSQLDYSREKRVFFKEIKKSEFISNLYCSFTKGYWISSAICQSELCFNALISNLIRRGGGGGGGGRTGGGGGGDCIQYGT